MTLTVECQGKDIVTIEGLADPVTGKLDPVQQIIMDYSAFQCGFCTPGIIIAAKALLLRNPHPTEDDFKEALAGNLCRCIRGLGARVELERVTWGSFRVTSGVLGLISGSGGELGVPLKLLQGNRASSLVKVSNAGFFSSCSRKLGVLLELQWGSQGTSRVAMGESGLLSICEGELEIPLKSVQCNWASSRVEGGTRGSFRVVVGNSGFL